ncbi:MAG: hypothetical protein C1943_05695 [Halochromatium sp.]|nr:hypothetical protein [Halochromatium sp.]
MVSSDEVGNARLWVRIVGQQGSGASVAAAIQARVEHDSRCPSQAFEQRIIDTGEIHMAVIRPLVALIRQGEGQPEQMRHAREVQIERLRLQPRGQGQFQR